MWYINTIHHTSFIKYKTYCVTIENFHNIITMKISGFQGNPAPRLDFASSCSNTDRGLRDNKSWMAVFLTGERHGETMGKPWENHGKTMGKPWETVGKPWETVGKPWETMGNRGKTWETVGKGGKPWETMGNHGKPLFNILKLPCHQGHLACTTFSGIALRKFAPKALGRTAASWTIMSSWRKFWGHRPSFMIQANYARKMHHLWGTNLNWVLQTTSSVRPHRENEKATWMTLYRTWPVKELIEETIHCGNTRRKLNTKYISKYCQ